MKQHPKFPHLYITEHGKVYSTKTNRFLKTTIHKRGYEVLSTKLKGRKDKTILLRVHRLVAETYVLNPLNKPFVNHKDGNKLNNVVSNLEWVTAKENSQHACRMGLQRPLPRDKRSQAKISSAELEGIRSAYIPYHKEFGLRALGRKHGISHSVLSRLIGPKGGIPTPTPVEGGGF